MHPTPLRGLKIGSILTAEISLIVFLIYQCGAGDARGVGPPWKSSPPPKVRRRALDYSSVARHPHHTAMILLRHASHL
jgi:hypothetical protein